MRPLAKDDPREIGPFRIIGLLGGGGMGRVYLGRAADGRTVAVKTARAELADDDGFRARFAREVAAARRVAGPFVAPVVDAAPHDDIPWMATAYVPGVSLTVAVRDGGPLPDPALRMLTAGLLHALAAVHAHGLVHRDLKPSNILLTADGPRVIDFGIAHSTADTALTVTGTALGTPGFMAPEQLAMNRPRVTGAADVFALGGVIVFAATGSGPFGSTEPQVLMYRTVHEEPQLDGVPASLRELAGACLAKEPERRPTVAALMARVGTPGPYGDWLPEPVAAQLGRLSAWLGDPRVPDTPDTPPARAAGPVGRPDGARGTGGAAGTAEGEGPAGTDFGPPPTVPAQPHPTPPAPRARDTTRPRARAAARPRARAVRRRHPRLRTAPDPPARPPVPAARPRSTAVPDRPPRHRGTAPWPGPTAVWTRPPPPRARRTRSLRPAAGRSGPVVRPSVRRHPRAPRALLRVSRALSGGGRVPGTGPAQGDRGALGRRAGGRWRRAGLDAVAGRGRRQWRQGRRR
ncbi:serine/threonine-protein kinase [Streptomyces pactum]|uniref:serine/threonine-protein kinase n=1 Tax=Streptomyces pactum TaxID=68249 RepID=UPI0027DE59E5|nr:serine/threonine-protein kinase [Streptomyces pactum]